MISFCYLNILQLSQMIKSSYLPRFQSVIQTHAMSIYDISFFSRYFPPIQSKLFCFSYFGEHFFRRHFQLLPACFSFLQRIVVSTKAPSLRMFHVSFYCTMPPVISRQLSFESRVWQMHKTKPPVQSTDSNANK